MRYYKKVLALFCAGLILFGLWGCSGRMDNREDTKTNRLDLPPEHLELSERQREILKKENLPQEYDKLTQTQKRAICRMEKMLCYLDEKYPGVEFRYLEYSAGYFDTEWLSVYPRGGSSSRDIVTVRPAGYNENGTFTDNYIGVYVRPYYEEAIAQYVKDYFQSGNVLVIGPDSVKTTLESTDDAAAGKIAGNCSGSCHIYFYLNLTDEKMKEFCEAFGAWCAENGYSGDHLVTLVESSEKLEEISEFNQYSYLNGDTYTLQYHCTVSTGGTVDIL